MQTEADLFASVTSPDLVLVNGGTGRYKVRLGNNSGLPAANTTLTLALPTGAQLSPAPARPARRRRHSDLHPRAASPPLIQQTLAISLTIARPTCAR